MFYYIWRRIKFRISCHLLSSRIETKHFQELHLKSTLSGLKSVVWFWLERIPSAEKIWGMSEVNAGLSECDPVCVELSNAVHHKSIIWQHRQLRQRREKVKSLFPDLALNFTAPAGSPSPAWWYCLLLFCCVYLMVCVWGMIAAWSKNRGRAGQVNRRAPALSFKTQREEEEEAQVVRSKIGLVFSQGPLTDTKSVFVCLPGCHIKEFLCVGGSDRVYLTLQLLLCSKCPTVNAGHESHLALDRGSLFSGERGSCLEKIFNGGECGGVSVRGGAAWSVHSAVYGHIVGLCPWPTKDRILYSWGRRCGSWWEVLHQSGDFQNSDVQLDICTSGPRHDIRAR